MRGIVLIDGQHYIPVSKAAIKYLEEKYKYKIIAAVFLGSMEKIGDESDLDQFGFPIIKEHNPINGIIKGIKKYSPEVVIDLSDEPVVGYSDRFKFANIIIKNNVIYKGADFQFDPPQMVDIMQKPSISFIGTGKRIGKTAITSYAGKVLAKKYNPCIVTMGRGGSAEPEILESKKIKLTPEYLLSLNNSGKHAASDHFEDAIVSGITTIGSRRCGGGMAGAPFYSNVVDSAQVANELDNDLIIFEGSGSSIPPVKADVNVLIIGANQPINYISGYLGAYRVLLSDIAYITLCEEPLAKKSKINNMKKELKKIKNDLKIIKTIFRPRPLDNIEGKRIFFTTTAPVVMKEKLIQYLENEYKCEVVGFSNNLSNQKVLEGELEKGLRKQDVDVLLTEIKAAAIRVSVKKAIETGIEVVFCDNKTIPLNDNLDIKEDILRMGKLAFSRFE